MKFLNIFQLTTGAALGKVLMSDASGVGTWQSVPTSSVGTFDGGSSTTTYTGVAKIDCGGAT